MKNLKFVALSIAQLACALLPNFAKASEIFVSLPQEQLDNTTLNTSAKLEIEESNVVLTIYESKGFGGGLVSGRSARAGGRSWKRSVSQETFKKNFAALAKDNSLPVGKLMSDLALQDGALKRIGALGLTAYIVGAAMTPVAGATVVGVAACIKIASDFSCKTNVREAVGGMLSGDEMIESATLNLTRSQYEHFILPLFANPVQ